MHRALTYPVGHETSFRIRTNNRQLLPEPYRMCTTDKYVKFNGSDIFDHIYSREFCQEICHQLKIIEKCGCLDVQYAASKEMLDTYPY